MNPQIDELIEDALHTYPLADVPSNLSQKIMGQIRAKSTRIAPPQIRFRLTWMDCALAFFLTLLPLMGLVVWATLPRLFVLRLTFQWQLLQANGFFPVLGLSLAVAVVLLLSAFLFSINLLLRQPFTEFQRKYPVDL